MNGTIPTRRAARAAAGWGATIVALAGVAAFALQLVPPRGAAASTGDAPRLRASFDGAPRRLSETGLYLADGSVDPRNRPFAPQYPLWTDGAVKSRWIRLPAGSTIDVSDIDAWRFPAGTILWKEFAWDGRRVETRMMRAEADGSWTLATYVWSEDQRDALLAPDDGVARVAEIAGGKRVSVPGVADCIACHGGAPSPVLGFSALQLSDDRDPLAPHAASLPSGALTLRGLIEADRLRPHRADLVANPPRIRSADPVERAALGYLSGNCGSCHNARGPLARLGFGFLHVVASEPEGREAVRTSAVGAHARFVVPGVAPESSLVIAAGEPARSAALHRMGSRRPSSQMPPIGTVQADTLAVALVRTWIESLSAGPPGAGPSERMAGRR